MRSYFVGSQKVEIRVNNCNHNLSDENYLMEYLGLCLRRIWFTRKFSIGNRTNARYKTSKSCNTSRSSHKYWSIPRNDRFNHRKVEKSGLRLHYLLQDILCMYMYNFVPIVNPPKSQFYTFQIFIQKSLKMICVKYFRHLVISEIVFS